MPDSSHWSSKRPLEMRGGHRVFGPFLLPPHPHQDTGKRAECLKLGSVREEVEAGQWHWKRVGRRPDLKKVYPDGVGPEDSAPSPAWSACLPLLILQSLFLHRPLDLAC